MEILAAMYMALTYRWPQNLPLEAKSTQDTVFDRESGLDVSKLPLSFNDVFQVAARLGLQYVWIDSLCIIQEDLDGWSRETARMCEIYQNAYLTLAIASSQTILDEGLFRRRDTDETLSKGFICPLEGPADQDIEFMRIQSEAYLYPASPLISRGWCF